VKKDAIQSDRGSERWETDEAAVRRLLLLRHTKSSWRDEALADIERPLAPRGRRAAPAIGVYLRDHALIPEFVLVSTAQRTRETWQLVNLMFAEAPTVRYDEKLYLADAEDILKRIAKAPATAATVMVIGHNPGLQELAVALYDGGEAMDFNRLKAKFPTGGLAIYEFDIDRWSDIREKSGRLVGFTAPRDLV
jgi:phosphohistidine phosphatase